MKTLSQLFLTAFFICMLPGFLNAETYEQKAENFIVLFDTSSSMMDRFQNSDMTKLTAAKRALEHINAGIPSFAYNSGLFLYTPFEEVKSISVHDPESFAASINALPDRLKWNGVFSGGTPLGYGLKNLSQTLESLSGKTVVYLFSDGSNTDILDPVEEAMSLNDNFDVCFSVVSLADGPAGSETLRQIAAANDCSSMVHLESADQDISIASNALFLAIADPFPLIEAEGYSAPDSDDDGVSDDLDMCSGTPVGYSVDAVGCRMKEPVLAKYASFESGENTMTPESVVVIDEIGTYLTRHPEAKVIISGYTDDTGDPSSNMKLSQERAEHVYNYLSSNFNIDKDSLIIRWFGELNPIASNKTDLGRQLNRCVHVKVQGAYTLNP